ncbi:MAG: serine protease [Pseudonocardia sp.]
MTVPRAARGGRVPRLFAAAVLVAGATTAGAVALPGSASADGRWASAGDATIHPGVMIDSEQGQCTANFIFTSGDKVLIGQAAHCTGKGSPNETDGCESESDPIGSEVKIDGADNPGKLVYNSWITMRENGEDDENTCAFNDFALVEIDEDDVDKVNPSVPNFGGPVALRTEGLAAGDQVFTYGNSGLRQGLSLLSPKQGINLGDGGDGFTHEIATLSPGVPGDSGSGYLDSDGRAFGVLSTLNLAPAPGTNGVSDLAKALDYANEHGDLGKIELVEGTEDFSGNVLPIPALGATPDEDSDGDRDSSGAGEAAPTEPFSLAPRGEDSAARGSQSPTRGTQTPARGEQSPTAGVAPTPKQQARTEQGLGLPLGL